MGGAKGEIERGAGGMVERERHGGKREGKARERGGKESGSE